MTDVYGCVSFPEVLSGFLIRTHTHVYLHYLHLFFFETNKMGTVCLHRSFFMYVVHTYVLELRTRYP